jgi:hypothetical protein
MLSDLLIFHGLNAALELGAPGARPGSHNAKGVLKPGLLRR